MIAFINLQIFWLYPQVASDPMGMATKIDQLCDSWPIPAKPSVVFVPAPLHPSTAQGLSKSASMGASHVPRRDAGGWMWRSLVIVRLVWQVHNKIQKSRMNAAKHVRCLLGFFLFAGHFPVYFQGPNPCPSTHHEPSFNIMSPGGTKRPWYDNCSNDCHYSHQLHGLRWTARGTAGMILVPSYVFVLKYLHTYIYMYKGICVNMQTHLFKFV